MLRVAGSASHGARGHRPLVVASADDVRPHDNESANTPQPVRWGIKTKTNDELRQEFIDELRRLCERST